MKTRNELTVSCTKRIQEFPLEKPSGISVPEGFLRDSKIGIILRNFRNGNAFSLLSFRRKSPAITARRAARRAPSGGPESMG